MYGVAVGRRQRPGRRRARPRHRGSAKGGGGAARTRLPQLLH